MKSSIFVVIGLTAGIIGGIAAFLNAGEGYSHFPGISRKKRIIFSLEMAFVAFAIGILGAFLAFWMVSGMSPSP